MNKSITCVVLAILLVLSFTVGQGHPVLHDATEPNVLLMTDEASGTTATDVDDAMMVHLS